MLQECKPSAKLKTALSAIKLLCFSAYVIYSAICIITYDKLDLVSVPKVFPLSQQQR
jgi:hypothetical protein